MSKLTRHPQVIWDKINEKTVLCHIDTGEFFHMDSLSALIWEVCDGCTIDDIVERIHASYPNNHYEQIRVEIQQFILSLQEAGLLERNG